MAVRRRCLIPLSGGLLERRALEAGGLVRFTPGFIQRDEVLGWIMNDNARVFLGARAALEADPEHALLKERFTSAMGLAEKDLSIALDVARDLGVSMPGTALTQQLVARLFGVADPKRR